MKSNAVFIEVSKNNTFFIIVVAVSLLFGVSFWANSTKNTNQQVWEILPQNTLFIWQTTNFYDSFEELSKKSIYQQFLKVNLVKNLHQNWADLLALKDIKTFLKNKNITISFLIAPNQESGFLLYVPVNKIEKETFIKATFDDLKENKKYLYSTTNYQKLLIEELNDRQNNRTFSFVLLGDFLVFTSSHFLIEDVIRQYITKKSAIFIEDNFKEISTPTGLGKGDFFVNLRLWNDFIKLFQNKENLTENLVQNAFPLVLADAVRMKLNFNDNQLVINGLMSGFELKNTTNTTENTPFLKVFDRQEAGKFILKKYVPEQTALLTRMNFDNPSKMQEDLKDYFKNTQPDILAKHTKIAFIDQFFKTLGTEIDECILNNAENISTDNSRNNTRKILLIHTKNQGAMLKILDEMQQNQGKNTENASEIYKENHIRFLNTPDFPSILLGKSFLGYSEAFYAPISTDVVAITNGLNTMKFLFDSIENEEVISKNVAQNAVYQSAQDLQKFGIFVNLSQIWDIWLQNTNQTTQKLMQENSDFRTFFDLISFQIVNQKPKTTPQTLVILHKNTKESTQKDKKTKLIPQFTADFDNYLTQPFALNISQNQDKDVNIFVQDDGAVVHYLSDKGKMIWSKNTDSPLVSPVFQVDILNNKKQQYLFATQNRVHLLDKKGEKVAGFPVVFPDEIKIKALQIFDYEQNKDYRFCVILENGDVYLLDKQGKKLEGWNPKKLGSRISQAPAHVKVAQKDYLIFLQDNGKVQIFNRKGELLSKISVDLDTKINTNFFIKKGINTEKTILTTISSLGELISFNLEGNIINRKQLLLSSNNTTFKLIKNNTNTNFVIIRQDFSKLAVLNENENLIFETDFSSKNDKEIQYFSLKGNEFIVVADKMAGFAYLFDLKGNILVPPFKSSHKIDLFYTENKLNIVTSFQKKLTKLVQ